MKHMQITWFSVSFLIIWRNSFISYDGGLQLFPHQTLFMKTSFPWTRGGGWFQYDISTLHLLCSLFLLLLYQLPPQSYGIGSWRLGTLWFNLIVFHELNIICVKDRVVILEELIFSTKKKILWVWFLNLSNTSGNQYKHLGENELNVWILLLFSGTWEKPNIDNDISDSSNVI